MQDFTTSIEHAVTCGSIDDVACAVRAHPYALLIPQELLEDATQPSFWDVVRFVTDAEIASSGGVR